MSVRQFLLKKYPNYDDCPLSKESQDLMEEYSKIQIKEIRDKVENLNLKLISITGQDSPVIFDTIKIIDTYLKK